MSVEPPPLSADTATYPTTVAQCCAPTAMAHPRIEEAETARALIDRIGCGSGCQGNHEIVWLTIAEGKRRCFCWYDEP